MNHIELTNEQKQELKNTIAKAVKAEWMLGIIPTAGRVFDAILAKLDPHPPLKRERPAIVAHPRGYRDQLKFGWEIRKSDLNVRPLFTLDEVKDAVQNAICDTIAPVSVELWLHAKTRLIALAYESEDTNEYI